MENDLSSVMMLLTSDQERLQLASLQVLAAVGFESQVGGGGAGGVRDQKGGKKEGWGW